MKSVMMNASQKLAKTTTKSHQNCLQKKKPHTIRKSQIMYENSIFREKNPKF